MRVISQEFRQMLKKSDVFALFSSSRRPYHSKLDKEVEQFEKWIADEHAKDRRLLLEASGKRLSNFLSLTLKILPLNIYSTVLKIRI